MTDFNSKGYNTKARNPLYSGGKVLRTVHAEMEIDVSEVANGDVFVLARNLPVGARIHRLFSPNATPVVTAADDNDFGFYKENSDGELVAIDADVVIDGADLTSALSTRDLLSLNSSLDRIQTIGELLSLDADEAPAGGVFFCMTMNTAATTSDQTLDLDVIVEYPTTN